MSDAQASMAWLPSSIAEAAVDGTPAATTWGLGRPGRIYWAGWRTPHRPFNPAR